MISCHAEHPRDPADLIAAWIDRIVHSGV